MFGSNHVRLMVLFFIVKSTILAVGDADDVADLESLDSIEDKAILDKYDKMEPLSVLRKTETMKIITNKTYELKIYPKNEEEMEKESPAKSNFIAKLLISSATKFLKDGKQVGSLKKENRSILLGENEVPVAIDNMSGDSKETNDTDTVPATADAGSETSSETGSSEEKEKEPETDGEKAEGEKTDGEDAEKEKEEDESESPISSAQPSAMVPSKVVTAPEVTEANTSSPSNSSGPIIDYISSALMSTAAGVYGSLFNNIILLFPIFIGLSFI